MPTQEDEQKPKVETQKGPETPEEAAARTSGAAQAGKEKQAAAALAGAETTDVPEAGRERERLQDIQYLHVEDDWDTRKVVAEELATKLGMTGKVGEAQTLQGAFETVKKLVQNGTPLDLIFLDRQLPRSEGDIAEQENGDEFLRVFEQLTKDPQFKDKLRDTRIIMMTSHADNPKAMARFRELSSRVIGGIMKEMKMNVEGIKAILIEAGVVKESENKT